MSSKGNSCMNEILPIRMQNVDYVKRAEKASVPQELKRCEYKQTDEIPNSCLGLDLVKPMSVIRRGDTVMESAYEAETKSGKSTFTIAKGDEVYPNIWDPNGGNYSPKAGDIILGYGNVPKDWGISNPNVLKEMEEKGLTEYPDRALSSEPEIMYKTYKGEDGRNFEEQPIQAGETVNAEKKIFPTKYLFVPTGTRVETLEAREGSQELPKVGDFQYIQIDANGNPYVKDVKDLIKRLIPKGEKSEEIFKEVKSLIDKRNAINNSDISENAKNDAISVLWQTALPELMK